MEFHPLANVFPLLEGAEFDGLVADVRANGLLEPITMFEGQILDGRNRFRACEATGVEPKLTVYVDASLHGGQYDQPVWICPRCKHSWLDGRDSCQNCHSVYREKASGFDAVAFVVSKNVARRHLNESQRADAAAAIANMRQGERTDIPSKEGRLSQEYAAKLLNVSVASVERAATVQREGVPELRKAVQRGQITVSKAAEVSKATPEFQRAVVAKIESDDVRPQEAVRRVKAETIAKAELQAPSGKYRVIYADPPWSYGNTQVDGFKEQRDHYPVMELRAICALPVREMAQDDAVLFMWTTSPMLEECFDVINAWGFRYKASFIWDKVKHVMGHYNSVRHELLLICVRGSCQPDVRTLIDSVVTIERTEHSRKPDRFYEIIETIYPHGSRVELFARGAPRDGWSTWGYEARDAAE